MAYTGKLDPAETFRSSNPSLSTIEKYELTIYIYIYIYIEREREREREKEAKDEKSFNKSRYDDLF